MLLLVFLIAILNLGVGYALGAGISFGSLMDLLPKRSPKPESVDIDDEPLTRPPTKPAEPSLAEGVPPKPSSAEVLASLNAFRDGLTSASVDLKLTQEDPERFEESANKLQQVNHAYLEETEGALQHLDELSAAGDTVAGAASKVVAKGAGQLAQASSEIDELIDSGLSDKASRSKLIDSSEQMRDKSTAIASKAATSLSAAEAAVAEVEAVIELADSAPSSPPAAEASSPASCASIDQLFDQLEAALEGTEEEATQYVAAIRVDPIADREDDTALIESIEQSVAGLAKELLAESQSFVAGRPAMALLHGDSFEAASERLERLRQQIASTTFQTSSGELQATVTCAVADAHVGDSRDKVIEQINTALDESTRQGPNQTFHHDGAFATAVPTAELIVEPRTVQA